MRDSSDLKIRDPLGKFQKRVATVRVRVAFRKPSLR
jgi:hypothetical protein